ncbi:MAG: penicillin-binding protein activator [Burkholderiaceae bacterium]|nr:penicillin-binding protein activator [Burkholderiaceae bacterium]
MRESAKRWMLGVLLCGLCLCASANTTNDEANKGAVGSSASAAQPEVSKQITVSLPPALPAASDSSAVARINVLLPLQSDVLREAADAVRAGFMAAYEQDRIGVAVTIVQTTDIPEEVVSDYTNALAGADVIVGPLTRSSAAAIAESGAVRIPTISLTQSDVESASAPALPPLMLTMGLSVEDEARQTADWVASGKPSGKVYAICTGKAWQRRAAKAFVIKAQARGLDPVLVELGSAEGYLSASDLAQLKKQLTTEKPAAAFLALTAEQARQVRGLIGADAISYGTAQLNPLALADWTTAERVPDLNGVRLLDIPWQLQADHPAVMIYPKLVVPADKKRSADLERLYALGIDAYRVARLVAIHRQQFELDGVTGRLIVGFNKAGVHFERVEPQAMYREGMVTLVDRGR